MLWKNQNHNINVCEEGIDKQMKKTDKNATDQIGYYFRKEKWLLLTVTITGILYNVGMVAGPWFEGQMVQYLCDIIGGKKRPSAMVSLVVCYVLTIFFVQFMRYLKRLYVRKFANNISKNMKMILYRNLLYQKNIEKEDAGTMMTKIIADADACVEGMRKFTTEIFDTGIVMIAYFVMLLSYDWRLTILSMLFPPIAYILAERLKVIVTRNVQLSRESSGRLNASTLERITNALTYRIYGQEKNRNAEYELYLEDYEKKAVRANLWENAMQPVYQVISMIGTVMIIWFGGRNVLGTGWLVWNIAAFSTFFACYRKLAVKSSKAAKLFNAVQKAQVSWKRIKPYLKETQEEKCIEHTQAALLEVSGLTFAWPDQKPVFTNVTFKGKPGQILGITGEVACGKSTLGRIFTGELPYDGKIAMGNISFDGKEGYISGVGYLGHQPELFDGTIEENICMGKPGDVEEVLHAVCMDREVALLPEKTHTRIGSGGVRLSGGQQARIALARTLYHKKPLMILDDPFSAVDMETEKQIYENLRLWGKDSIILLISHRLGLFPKFDQVLWLENGKVYVASHDRLMQEKEHYRLLYEEQERGGNAYAE